MRKYYVSFALLLAAAPCAAILPAQAQTPPPVFYDASRLPAPARLMRERILKAAKSGDIEALRPLLSNKNGQTAIVPEGSGQDPINYLKQISADGAGLEVLAALAQILQSGAVRSADGSYVWPYFTAWPPQSLSKKQMVEAYQIMSVDDFDTIKELGHYIYYRAGISADGQWLFFLTGDDAAAEAESGSAETKTEPEPNNAGSAGILPPPGAGAPVPSGG